MAKVEFVNAVTAGGSVKFVASGVNFSIFNLKIRRCKIFDKFHVCGMDPFECKEFGIWHETSLS